MKINHMSEGKMLHDITQKTKQYYGMYYHHLNVNFIYSNFKLCVKTSDSLFYRFIYLIIPNNLQI